MSLWTQFRVGKPIHRKFICAISHVFAAENAKFQHGFRGQFRPKLSIEIPTYGFRTAINVTGLHDVVDNNLSLFHLVKRAITPPHVSALGQLPSFLSV